MYLAGVLSGGIQKEIQDMITMGTEGLFRMWEMYLPGCFPGGTQKELKDMITMGTEGDEILWA